MRKILLSVFCISLIVACAPGKGDKTVKVEIYCDSCYVKINNTCKVDNTIYSEVPFEGVTTGYGSHQVIRYNIDHNCIYLNSFVNYSNDTAIFIGIENGDTSIIERGFPGGYCY